MFNLTREEREVILFLMAVALLGLGINFTLKANSRLVKVLVADERITKINLNQVSSEELINSLRITPKLAKNIIAYRDAKGEFKDIEELKEIKGIGDYRYEKLKDFFFVE